MSVLHIRGVQAAQKATEENSLRFELPLIGTVTLPPTEQLAYVGGITLLVALDVIEWPVGVALTAGHILSTVRHNKVVQDFGHALESALPAGRPRAHLVHGERLRRENGRYHRAGNQLPCTAAEGAVRASAT